jgi:RNA polymerase sigma-70 factor (ECF subfamily)
LRQKSSVPPARITYLLHEMGRGNREAESTLITFLYPHLRRLAARFLRGERRDHTLQPTTLVHEAYLRLKGAAELDWRDRAHFFAVAAGMMRHILADHARKRVAGKRGGSRQRVELDQVLLVTGQNPDAILEIDSLLSKLEEIDPRLCRVVELLYFGGMTEQETAEVLGISAATVKREWKLAKAWLYEQLTKRV